MDAATLGEGHTPLVGSTQAGRRHGLDSLLFKLESANPSGSYKDRFVAAEMSRMRSMGARACVATSSGNTGSSLAAFCARYAVPCVIVVNQHVPAGKLRQMLAHGARVIRVRDFVTSPAVTESVLDSLESMSRSSSIPLVISAYRYCPTGMAGVESIAAELATQADRPIDHVFVPVGGGGLISAVCRGFARPGSRGPRVHAVQPDGCSTVVAALERGDDRILPVESRTAISGLAVPFDIDASLALGLVRASGGRGFSVSDDDIFEAQRVMFEEEGIYAEPAGAAALAGLVKAVHAGVVRPDDLAVCLVTGHGFKDPESVDRVAAHHEPALISHTDLESRVLDLVASCA